MPDAKEQQEETPKSYISIEFSARGTADPNIQFEGVNPVQILAAAKMLELIGMDQVHQTWAAQRMQAMQQQQELAAVKQMMGRKSDGLH